MGAMYVDVSFLYIIDYCVWKKYCRVVITITITMVILFDCCVYYSLLLVDRPWLINEVFVPRARVEFVILEVGNFHGGSVGDNEGSIMVLKCCFIIGDDML